MDKELNVFFGGVVPLYDSGRGYGFLDGSMVRPVRRVSPAGLYAERDAVCIQETDEARFERYAPDATDYDLGGMLLRVDIEPGTYDIEVECTRGGDVTSVAVDGMRPGTLLRPGFWDAACQIPIRNLASWEGRLWSFTIVSVLGFLVISIEPLRPRTVVGLKRIHLRKHPEMSAPRSGPTILLLGDSTVKTYIYQEAPMSGWGQFFHRIMDPERVSVVNYSEGGRSLRRMWVEGRFLDLLLYGQKGDFVLLQSGHNDEKADADDGERSRFGRGSTEEMYYGLLMRVFLPAIRLVGMIPVLVTPMTRIDARCGDDQVFENSFRNRKFPEVMRRAAAEAGVLLLDLNTKSISYLNQIGAPVARAMVMSLEAGESPGWVSSGSLADGNPGDHADGTHYKECLARQYCRILAEEIYRKALEGDGTALALYGLMNRTTVAAVQSGDFGAVFPEVCKDTLTGRGAYYRNQIERMVQLGVFQKDEEDRFRPFALCGREEFQNGIRMLWNLSACLPEDEIRGPLLRGDAAVILYHAFLQRFGAQGAGCPPSVPFEALQDVAGFPGELLRKVEFVYRKGIMRCEDGIERGKCKSGVLFRPWEPVTREKAAKLLYFCFVLGQDPGRASHLGLTDDSEEKFL